MKQVVLLIILLVGYSASAQIDFRFADSTAQWNVLETGNALWCACYSYSTYLYHVSGDTTINGLDYQVVQSDGSSFPSKFLLRRDSNNKIYLRNDSAERMIYDFSLAAGDTFVEYYPEYFTTDSVLVTIDSTDNTFIGYSRKRLYVTYHGGAFQNSLFSSQWIEGIGTIGTPFFNPGSDLIFIDGPSYGTICFFENDNLLYSSDLSSIGCKYDTTIYLGINDISTQYVKLSPNPVTQNQLTVTLSEMPKANTAFMLYDAVGRLVRREELNSINQTIYTSGLANGIYTYIIEADKVKSGSGKLVVTK